MHKLLDEKDLPDYYALFNKAQKKSTEGIKNIDPIDLLIVLDISGSMNDTCNRAVNLGVGYYIGAAAAFAFLSFNPIIGGLVALSSFTTTKLANDRATTRLQEAKKHLIVQIKQLIKENRIHRLGLITFNHKAKIAIPLTFDFDKVFASIE